MEPIVHLKTHPSEPSSPSPVDNGDEKSLHEMVKMKEKAPEKEPTNNLHHGSSSIVLHNFNFTNKGNSKLELNIQTKSLDNAEEVIDETTLEKKPGESRVYACNFCKGKYSTAQGLGGHQNAHKHERALAKRQKERLDVGGGLDHFTYSSYPTLSVPRSCYGPYGYHNRSPVGVKANSLIHKPSFSPHPWSSSPSGYQFSSRGGWSRPPMMNPQRSLDSLRLESLAHVNNGGGFTNAIARARPPMMNPQYSLNNLRLESLAHVNNGGGFTNAIARGRPPMMNPQHPLNSSRLESLAYVNNGGGFRNATAGAGPPMMNPQLSLEGLAHVNKGGRFANPNTIAGAGSGSSSSWNFQRNNGVFGRINASPSNNSARKNKAFENDLVDAAGLDLSLKL